jgi:hypothetical protein
MPHSLLGMDAGSGNDLVRAGYDALSRRLNPQVNTWTE